MQGHNPVGISRDSEENLIKQPLDEIVRLGAQELLAKALEVEVNLFIERYQYVIDEKMHRQVVRNGYHAPRKITTGAGPVEVRVPRVDDRALEKQRELRFSSNIVPPYLRKTKNVEELLPVLYLKGISSGDFQEALENILGKDAVGLSAQTIGRLKEIWRKEYEQWAKRDLSSVDYVYWWADGVYFNVRLGDDKRICVLVIIGAKSDGSKDIIAVVDGFRESKEHWATLLRSLKSQGLKQGPRLAIADGALGFWAAMAEVFPEAESQLCWVHKLANVLDKLPNYLQNKAKSMLYDIFMAPTKMDANTAFDLFIKEFNVKYPKAVNCVRYHRQELMAFYNFPAEHWGHIRSTNVIESPFATVRLRTDRTKGCGSTGATLTMVFKLLQSAKKTWIKLRSREKVEEVYRGVKFENGIKVETKQQGLAVV